MHSDRDQNRVRPEGAVAVRAGKRGVGPRARTAVQIMNWRVHGLGLKLARRTRGTCADPGCRAGTGTVRGRAGCVPYTQTSAGGRKARGHAGRAGCRTSIENTHILTGQHRKNAQASRFTQQHLRHLSSDTTAKVTDTDTETETGKDIDIDKDTNTARAASQTAAVDT